MSIFGALAPLYLLGLGALSLPLIFHLIRRTPSGDVQFSSLMFLQPSPPRITKRSRLDNILLLILRALAICLIAFAFTRPLFRQGLTLDLEGVRNRQVAILVDVSASMQRDGAWNQVEADVDRILNDLEEGDQVALFTFDNELQVVVDFDDSLPDKAHQARTIRAAFNQLKPGWHSTRLPGCLVSLCDHLVATSLQKQSDKAPLGQIYLLSDLQPGRPLAQLHGYDWPENVKLAVRGAQPDTANNAGVRLLYGDTPGSSATSQEARVRIANVAHSRTEQFTVHWVGDDGRITEGFSYHVPGGDTRVIRLRSEEINDPIAIRLIGDAAAFDNEFHLPRPRQERFRVALFAPTDITEEASLSYFLDAALIDNNRRSFVLEQHAPDQPLEVADQAFEVGESTNDISSTLRWVVVAQPLSPDARESVLTYARNGGRVLVVMTTQDMNEDVSEYLGTELTVSEADTDEYALIAGIDFDHELFRVFADPRFSDFTQIRFWSHRQLSFETHEELTVPASLDDGSPLLIERQADEGRLHVLTASWIPAESQLALTTKFVPLVAGLAGDRSRESQQLYFEIGDPIPLPPSINGTRLEVRTPDGNVLVMEEDATHFTETMKPGRYEILGSGSDYAVAVNVAASESNTDPFVATALEEYGIHLGDQPEQREQVKWERDLRDRELESRQKMWSWLIVGAIAFLFSEMWFCGLIQKRRTAGLVSES